VGKEQIVIWFMGTLCCWTLLLPFSVIMPIFLTDFGNSINMVLGGVVHPHSITPKPLLCNTQTVTLQH
jgi:hypothetical protein